MAGPSVMVRILGDVTGLSNSMKTSGEHAASAASKAQAAFGSLLGTLNRTGVLGPLGEALDTVNEGFGALVEHGKTVSDVMLAAGGTVAGVGVLFSALGSKEQQAHQQLAAAIEATGHSYSQYGAQIDEAIKHQEKFGNSSEQTQNALQKLTQATHSPAEALKLLSTASDVAAAQHESLATAATQVGQAYNNSGRLLKQYGIVLDKHTHLTKDGLTATQALAQYTKGQAAAASDTFNGRIKALSTTIEDHVALLGEKWGPKLQMVGAALAGLGSVIKIVQAGTEALSAVTKSAAAADDVMAASEVTAETAGAPLILILGAIALAVVALIAVGYVIYRNWTTIWAAIKAVVKDVWDWIRTNWPLLLGILTGPIGIAAALIYKYRDQIWNAIKAVWNWIVSTWGTIEHYLTAPFVDAWHAITGAWSSVSSFFSGIVGTIGRVISGVENAIEAPFQAAWNFVQRIIGDIQNAAKTAGNIAGGIVSHIPGAGLVKGVLSHLATGGIVTRPTLALVGESGPEAVVPLNGKHAPLGGPAVVIHHAHFATEMDVDLFMRRAAWALQTRRM